MRSQPFQIHCCALEIFKMIHCGSKVLLFLRQNSAEIFSFVCQFDAMFAILFSSVVCD